MTLIHNERTKLTAVWLNTLAAATVVAGVIAPIAAVVFVGTIYSRETARMTAFELYALFGAPLLLFLVGLGMVWLTRFQDERDKPRHGAAE